MISVVFRRLAVCLAAAAVALPLLASADSALEVRVLDQTAAPIEITRCWAQLKDSNVGNIDYYLQGAVAFRNVSDKTARAIEFAFGQYDVFGAPLGISTGTLEGTYSPGVDINPRSNSITGQPLAQWSWLNLHGTTRIVQCAVSRVLFADGTQWNRLTATPAPPSTPTPPAVPAVVVTLAPGESPPPVPPTPTHRP
jgi:hypothetical protein